MSPAAMALWLAVGVLTDRLWLHRYEAFDALMAAVDRLCEDPEPPPAAGEAPVVELRNVRVLRPIGGGDEGPGAAA